MSELADVQHTEPVDDDTEPLSAHLPSSVAISIQNRSNDMTAHISVDRPTTEQTRKNI